MTVWHSFKETCSQRRAVPGCFGFTGAKESCGGSSMGFRKSLIYQWFVAVKLKQELHRIFKVLSMIKLKQ